MSRSIEKELLDFAQKSKIALTLADADSEDAPLLFVNTAFSEMTGYDPEDCIGRNCRFLQGHQRTQDGIGQIRRFIKDPTRTYQRASIVNFRKSGASFINLLTLARLTDSSGATRYFFASQFDLGSASTSELESYDERLRSRFSEVGDIASNHRIVLRDSLNTLADGTARIAQARLLLAELD